MNTQISISTQEIRHFFQKFKQIMLSSSIMINTMRLLALVVQNQHKNAMQSAETWQNWLAENENPQSKWFTALLCDYHITLSQIAYADVLPFLQYLDGLQQKGLLDQQGKIELLKNIFSYYSNTYRDLYCHHSVYELVNAIFAKYNNKSVYVPFDSSAYSIVALSAGQAVSWENGAGYQAVPDILKLILDNVEYKSGQAIENPAYIENRELKKFAKGFVLPPFGMKFQATLDPRFAVPSNNISHLYIQHLLQQTTDIAVVCVPIGQLYSGIAPEVAFREWLLNQGVLKAVINLPSNLLLNANVAFALLVLEPNAQHKNVQFINVKQSEFVRTENKETQLIQIDKLANLIFEPSAHSCSKLVSHDEIRANNCVLDSERYVLDDKTEIILSILAQAETRPLAQLVEILRPIANAKLKDGGAERIFEVQAADIPDYGYIQTASKEVEITENLRQKSENQFLQADDIILTVRGSTGKIGIVSAELVEQYENRAIVGQTGLILRVKNNQIISAKSLLMQLRSPMGQQRLKLISTGETISGISLKDLNDFPIIVPSIAEQAQAERVFDEQTQIQQNILQQQHKLAELANSIWTI